MIDSEKTKTEIFFEKLQNFKAKIVKSVLVKVLTLLICVVVLLSVLLPHFLDSSILKSEIAQKISQISGAEFVVKGNVKVELLPFPAIIAQDVLLQNYKSDSGKVYNFYVKSLKIKLGFFRFFQDRDVKKITLNEAVFRTYYQDSPTDQFQDKFNEISTKLASEPVPNQEKNFAAKLTAKLFSPSNVKDSEFSSKSFPDLIIENGEAIFYDRLGKKKEIKSISGELKSNEKKIVAAGSFNSQNVVSNFKFLAKFNQQSGKENSFLKITSPAMRLNIVGNFPNENRGIIFSDFKGKLDLEILELKPFLKSYIVGDSALGEKIKISGKPIKISANVDNKAAEVNVDNLVIASELINGKGDIELNLSNQIPLIDVDLSLEDFDFDSIWSDEPVSVVAKISDNIESKDLGSEGEEAFLASKLDKVSKKIPKFKFNNKIKNFDLNAEVKIKNIKYLKGEIKDADAYLTVSQQGEILLLPMIFKIPGNGLFRVRGVFDNNLEFPKFIGKFDVEGKNLKEVLKWLKIESQNLKFDSFKEYSLNSDIMLLPNNINLSNIFLNLNSGSSEFLGEMQIDGSNKVAQITSRFHAGTFNIDDYFLVSQKNAYFSPGLLIKKLFWLNEISSDSSFDLSFDSLIYKGEIFLDQSAKIKFGRGYFAINDLNLNSDKTNLKADLLVDISDKNPRFEIKVDAANFHYELAEKNVVQDSGQNLFDQFFALPSLEGFNGKVDLNFTDLKLSDRQIRNSKLSGKLDDGNLENIEINSDIYGGHLQYKGLIGVKLSKVINGNLTFSNAALQPFFNDLLGITRISGITNVSASLTSIANSSAEFLKKLESEIKFNSSAPAVEGYGLNDIMVKMFSPKVYANELSYPENILFNPQAKTVFKQASGEIKIDGEKAAKFNINASSTAINGVFSGSIDLVKNNIDATFNVIFLTGTRQKQTPINIASNLKGDIKNFVCSSNINQVRQYLGLPKIVAANSASEAKTVSGASLENQIPPEQKTILLDKFWPTQPSTSAQ